MRDRTTRGVRRVWKAPLAIVLITCSGTTAPVPGFPLTSSVVTALRDARPHVLRLDDWQRSAPCATTDSVSLLPSATCAPLPPSVAQSLAALAPRVAAAGRAAPSADAMWASALLDLATGLGDSRRLDRVIARLREVQAREPGRALVSNHLALAHMARAGTRDDARDLFTALEYIELAVEQDSMSHALRFNRAVLHELVGTTRRARVEWELVCVREQHADWRAEAVERLAALPDERIEPFLRVTPETIARDPQGAREFALDSLLLRWAQAEVARNSGAVRVNVEQLQMVAAGLLAFRGDSSVEHVVREVLTSGSASDVITATKAIQAYRLTHFDSTVALLSIAVPRLRRTGAQATADWSELMLGGARLAQRRYPEAIDILEAIAKRAAVRGDRALEARALWASGVAVARNGAMDDGERRFSRARELFREIGESRNAATMANSLADTQGLLGRTREAANSAFLGFTEGARNGGLVRFEDLLVLADQLKVEGRPYAAAHFLSEALLATETSHRAKDRPEALGRLAVVYAQLGRALASKSALFEARALARQVSDTAMQSRLNAELARAEVRLVAETDPALARALVDTARLHFASNLLDDAPLLYQRARLNLTLGDSAAALGDLAQSIRETRAQFVSATPDQARQLVATLQDAQRMRIEVALARGDTSGAFEQTMRLASIDLRRSGDAPLVERALPDAHAELRFVVLPSAVLSFVRTPNGRAVVRTALTRETLANQLWRLLNLARAGEDTATVLALGRDFYRALVAPHEQMLSGSTVLEMHADGVLADLPLAALPDDRDRQLGARFAIRVIVPAGRRQDGPVKSVSSVPLLIGDPAWRRSEHPDLEPLRWADEEVQRVAALYPRAEVLSGAAATKAALIAAMPNHAVIHFAGHSRVDVERGETSHLVLAGGDTYAAGVLTAAEIAQLDLRGVKLVVLSSCGRTRDDATSLGVVNALAVAFLDAGVERVVAGSTEVEDGVAAGMALRAHGGREAARSSPWLGSQAVVYGRQ